MKRTARTAAFTGRAENKQPPRAPTGDKHDSATRIERFCLAYHKDPNGKKAAIAAGYAERTAASTASRLLTTDKVKARLAELAELATAAGIADAHERQRFWTSVMRGELQEHTLFFGEVIARPATLKDRLKAAELLGKAHGDFIERVEVSGELGVIGIEILPPAQHDDER